MAALIAAARDPDYPAEIVLVVSNRPDAPGWRWRSDGGRGDGLHRPSPVQGRPRRA